MDEKALEEIRAELRVIRSMVQPVTRELTSEERDRALRTLARVRRKAKMRPVRVDSTVLIRKERDR